MESDNKANIYLFVASVKHICIRFLGCGNQRGDRELCLVDGQHHSPLPRTDQRVAGLSLRGWKARRGRQGSDHRQGQSRTSHSFQTFKVACGGHAECQSSENPQNVEESNYQAIPYKHEAVTFLCSICAANFSSFESISVFVDIKNSKNPFQTSIK